jgi:Transposase
LLFVGDDWAEDHHDIEVQDATGRRLAKGRCAEGLAGVAQLHALIAPYIHGEPDEVAIGIEPTGARG